MALTRDISCHEAVALVSDYLEGALTFWDRRRLERHLAHCPACSSYLSQMRVTIQITGSVGPDDLSPEALDDLTELFERYRHDTSD